MNTGVVIGAGREPLGKSGLTPHDPSATRKELGASMFCAGKKKYNY